MYALLPTWCKIITFHITKLPWASFTVIFVDIVSTWTNGNWQRIPYFIEFNNDVLHLYSTEANLWKGGNHAHHIEFMKSSLCLKILSLYEKHLPHVFVNGNFYFVFVVAIEKVCITFMFTFYFHIYFNIYVLYMLVKWKYVMKRWNYFSILSNVLLEWHIKSIFTKVSNINKRYCTFYLCLEMFFSR